MAEVRKSATQAAARKRAREKAAAFREKQDKLEQLAVDYFVATDGIDTIENEIEEELTAVRARGTKRLAESKAEADQVVSSMLALGVARSEVADRLGITTRDVKKAPATKSPVAGSPAPTVHSSDEVPAEHDAGSVPD